MHIKETQGYPIKKTTIARVLSSLEFLACRLIDCFILAAWAASFVSGLGWLPCVLLGCASVTWFSLPASGLQMLFPKIANQDAEDHSKSKQSIPSPVSTADTEHSYGSADLEQPAHTSPLSPLPDAQNSPAIFRFTEADLSPPQSLILEAPLERTETPLRTDASDQHLIASPIKQTETFTPPAHIFSATRLRTPDTDSTAIDRRLSDLGPLAGRTSLDANDRSFSDFLSPSREQLEPVEECITAATPSPEKASPTSENFGDLLDAERITDLSKKAADNLVAYISLILKIKAGSKTISLSEKKSQHKIYVDLAAHLNNPDLELERQVRLARVLTLIARTPTDFSSPAFPCLNSIPESLSIEKHITDSMISDFLFRLKNHEALLDEHHRELLSAEGEDNAELKLETPVSKLALADFMAAVQNALDTTQLRHQTPPQPQDKAPSVVIMQTPEAPMAAQPTPPQATEHLSPAVSLIDEFKNEVFEDALVDHLAEMDEPPASVRKTRKQPRSFAELCETKSSFLDYLKEFQKNYLAHQTDVKQTVLSDEHAQAIASGIQQAVYAVVSDKEITKSYVKKYRAKYSRRIQELSNFLNQIKTQQDDMFATLSELTNLLKNPNDTELKAFHLKTALEDKRVQFLNKIKKIPQYISILYYVDTHALKPSTHATPEELAAADLQHIFPVSELFNYARAYLGLMNDLDKSWMEKASKGEELKQENFLNPNDCSPYLTPVRLEKILFTEHLDVLPVSFENETTMYKSSSTLHPFSYPLSLINTLVIDISVLNSVLTATEHKKPHTRNHRMLDTFNTWGQSLLRFHVQHVPRFTDHALEVLKVGSLLAFDESKKANVLHLIEKIGDSLYKKEQEQMLYPENPKADASAFCLMLYTSLEQASKKTKSLDSQRITNTQDMMEQKEHPTDVMTVITSVALDYYETFQKIQERDCLSCVAHISPHYAAIFSLLSTPLLEITPPMNEASFTQLLDVAQQFYVGDKYPNASTPACHYLGRTLLDFLRNGIPSSQEIDRRRDKAFQIYAKIGSIQITQSSQLPECDTDPSVNSLYSLDPLTSIHVLLDHHNSLTSYPKDESASAELKKLFRKNISTALQDHTQDQDFISLITTLGETVIGDFSQSSPDPVLFSLSNALVAALDLFLQAHTVDVKDFTHLIAKMQETLDSKIEGSQRDCMHQILTQMLLIKEHALGSATRFHP